MFPTRAIQFRKNAMSRSHRVLTIFVCLFSLAFTISGYAEKEIEDLIDIIQSENEIIAIIKGIKKKTVDLRANEKVLWSGSRGYLGAYLTTQNFFVISTTSNSWQALPLRGSESDESVASISPYIALLATENRVISFNAR